MDAYLADWSSLEVALFIGLLLVAWVLGRFASRPDFSKSSLESSLESIKHLESRLGDMARNNEVHTLHIDDALSRVHELTIERHAALSHLVEQRLADLKSQQSLAATNANSTASQRHNELQRSMLELIGEGQTRSIRTLADLQSQLQSGLGQHQTQFEQRQGEALKVLQDTLQNGSYVVQRQVAEALGRNAEELGRRLDGLAKTTDERLKEISGEVERRLSVGFEKTTATFTDVLTRLALIDEAQKKITELSQNVVSLQEVLSDKRSRGAFGEVQLNGLVSNVLPAESYALQQTLSNDRVADCVLFLPPPTGNVVVDAKFPLESYQRMSDTSLTREERKEGQRQFKQDIRKHIHDIATRYVLPGETSNGAMMFIPAEAVFAEIQAHHYDLVAQSQRQRVWMVSPTTLMAILNTARAVLKDEATQKQVHIIRRHLVDLSKDFERFQRRMDNLSKHVKLANRDVEEVHISAQKISTRFGKIERVDVDAPRQVELEESGEG